NIAVFFQFGGFAHIQQEDILLDKLGIERGSADRAVTFVGGQVGGEFGKQRQRIRSGLDNGFFFHDNFGGGLRLLFFHCHRLGGCRRTARAHDQAERKEQGKHYLKLFIHYVFSL